MLTNCREDLSDGAFSAVEKQVSTGVKRSVSMSEKIKKLKLTVERRPAEGPRVESNTERTDMSKLRQRIRVWFWRQTGKKKNNIWILTFLSWPHKNWNKMLWPEKVRNMNKWTVFYGHMKTLKWKLVFFFFHFVSKEVWFYVARKKKHLRFLFCFSFCSALILRVKNNFCFSSFSSFVLCKNENNVSEKRADASLQRWLWIQRQYFHAVNLIQVFYATLFFISYDKQTDRVYKN